MKNNKKGYSLIELLMVVAVIAMTTPLLFWVFMYGTQAFSTDNRHVEQHYKIIDVTQRIRKDIEEAAACKAFYDASSGKPEASELTLWIPDEDVTNPDKYIIRRWRLEDGKMFFKSCEGIYPDKADPDEWEDKLDAVQFGLPVLDGLDTEAVQTENGSWHMPTGFENSLNGNVVILSIKPIETNDLAFKNRNVAKPIITEFSVLYKELIN